MTQIIMSRSGFYFAWVEAAQTSKDEMRNNENVSREAFVCAIASLHSEARKVVVACSIECSTKKIKRLKLGWEMKLGTMVLMEQFE